MSRWWTPRAISAHVTLAICEPGFAALAWWQVNRALGGNDLSWLYVFEWPFFGLYAVFLWWRIVHDQPLARWRRPTPAPAPPAGADHRAEGEDAELAAYNRYLARLAAENSPKRW